MTEAKSNSHALRRVRLCLTVTGITGVAVLLWAALMIPVMPYFVADQILSRVDGLSVPEQDGKQTHEQVVAALKTGELNRQVLTGALGLVLVVVSAYGWVQSNKVHCQEHGGTLAERSDETLESINNDQ